MQYLRVITLSVSVRVPNEDASPALKDFVGALEKNLEWWKTKATQADISGPQSKVDHGVTMNRHHDGDVWVH